MRKVIVFWSTTAVCLLLCSLSTSGRTLRDYDGHDWVQSSRVQKLAFMQGFLVGIDTKRLECMRDAGFKSGQSDAEMKANWKKFMANPRRTLYDFGGIPVEKLINGLDVIYRHEENRSISFFDAMCVVRSILNGDLKNADEVAHVLHDLEH